MLSQKPTQAEISPNDQILRLKDWFEATFEQLKMHMPSKRKEEAMGRIG